MILVSSTVFLNIEINQNWNYNKVDKATKHMFSINYWNLQSYFTDYSESWNIHFLSEFLSEFSCFLSAKENKEKWHDMSNWNSMHSHQKKTLLKRTKLLNFSYYCNSFQIFICELNSVLNLKHKRHMRQIT